MTNKEVLEKIEQIKSRLVNSITDDIFNDGRDENDSAQNNRYANQVKIIREANNELSKIEVDDVDTHEIDQIWAESWSSGDEHLPEVQYNHAIQYIENIKKLISQL